MSTDTKEVRTAAAPPSRFYNFTFPSQDVPPELSPHWTRHSPLKGSPSPAASLRFKTLPMSSPDKMPPTAESEQDRRASLSPDEVQSSTLPERVPARASSPPPDKISSPAEPDPIAMPLPDCHGSSLSRRDSTGSNRTLTSGLSLSATAPSRSQLSLRASPPSTRLLAGTYASSTRPSPATTRRAPIPTRRPSSTSISRLPRPDVSYPITTIPTTRWGARVNKSISDTGVSNQLPRPSPSGPVSAKPLPPRPVATLASTPSPSKDGRTLIDASEQPLQIITDADGDAHDWPALTPRSFSAPHQFDANARVTPSSIPRMVSISHSHRSAQPSSRTLVDHVVGRTSALTDRTSHLSFVTADEAMDIDARSGTASFLEDTSQKSTREDPAPQGIYPSRDQSLAASHSFDDLRSSTEKPLPQLPTLPDFANEMLTSEYEAHKRNTPPANFSRPMSKSPNLLAESPSFAANARQQKTASRIPRFEYKSRPVRVNSQGLDVASEQPTQSSPSLSGLYSTSPSAFAVTSRELQHHIQRTNTNGSTASEDSPSLPRRIRKYRTRDHSGSSTPAYTTGASSADEEDLVTPVSSPSLPRSSSMANLTPGEENTDDDEPFMSYSPNIPRTKHLPPSTSRHTDQLATIPSLPDFKNCSTHLSPTPRKYIADAKTEIEEELNVVDDQNDAVMKEEQTELDCETKDQHTHTLSQLEGHRRPTRQFTNDNRLLQTLTPTVHTPSYVRPSDSFIAAATVAQKYVEQDSVGSEQIEARQQKVQEEEAQAASKNEPGYGDYPAPNIPSKWSDSTPSGMASSSGDSPREPQTSIGFPSADRIPSTRAAHPSASASRHSSPTLGITTPYQPEPVRNVKRAREDIGGRGGFARMTAASAAKASPSTRTPRAPGNPMGPRARSKSRTVLAKVAGFFSHKKEKKPHQLQVAPGPPSPPTLLEAEQPEPAAASPANDTTSAPLDGESDDVKTLAEKLEEKARLQSSPTSKARMMNFAHILREAVANAKEAEKFALAAKQAAEQAETAHEKTKVAADMLQRLATSLVRL
ncbi:hypothetical protein CB0940_07778 [Cercospora beticola]|uniref:Uncharacterized protein n=1 Tax=Cercospora beticola TaxID=122368 RepID=A0A2G5H893_CERBT|nr:hypothetical protein CB0940_07778 [Cercospora beticola]PIA88749.1 hypothetical protein CB0940_07778 [Cercospora beticola]WPB03746.1 hypothetical protein RHO25_008390 [Cercospora beticola]